MIIFRNFEQREYARKDFEGLSEADQKSLAIKRHQIAEDLAKRRNKINAVIENSSLDNPMKFGNEMREKALDRANINAKLERDAILNNKIKSTGLPGDIPVATTTTSAANGGVRTVAESKEKLIKRLANWVKRNPRTSVGAGVGLAAVGTGGYLAYKHNKNK